MKKLYKHIKRFTGSGDRGIDIAGFADDQKRQGVWDSYQCKHYNAALTPVNAWPEIGKLLWHTFNKEYRVPRKYFFVAPFGAGTMLSGLLSDSDKLKAVPFEHRSANAARKETASPGQS